MARPKGSKNKPKTVADMPDLSSVYRRPKMDTVADLIAARKATKKAERKEENVALTVVAVAVILGVAVLVHSYLYY